MPLPNPIPFVPYLHLTKETLSDREKFRLHVIVPLSNGIGVISHNVTVQPDSYLVNIIIADNGSTDDHWAHTFENDILNGQADYDPNTYSSTVFIYEQGNLAEPVSELTIRHMDADSYDAQLIDGQYAINSPYLYFVEWASFDQKFHVKSLIPVKGTVAVGVDITALSMGEPRYYEGIIPLQVDASVNTITFYNSGLINQHNFITSRNEEEGGAGLLTYITGDNNELQEFARLYNQARNQDLVEFINTLLGSGNGKKRKTKIRPKAADTKPLDLVPNPNKV